MNRGQNSAGPRSASAQAADCLGNAEHASTPTARPERLCTRAWSSGKAGQTLRLGLWPGVSCRLEVSIKAVCFPVCLCVLCGGDHQLGWGTAWACSLHPAPYSFLQQTSTQLCARGCAPDGSRMSTNKLRPALGDNTWSQCRDGAMSRLGDLCTTHCVHAQLSQSCLTLCDPLDCNQPGSSVHGILQAKIQEWVAISSSRGSSQPRDQTRISCIADGFFTH